MPRPNTLECTEYGKDDTAIVTWPSQQVDYLSHDWREEDIWFSWRYIVNRRGESPNSARLENAAWRAWMKSKNKLKTISPGTLNWPKECDATWLYGPLQPGTSHLVPSKPSNGSASISETWPSVNLDKKPILKRRNTSEVVLQRSLPTTLLLKPADRTVVAQETEGISTQNPVHSNTAYMGPTRKIGQGNASSMAVSIESSGITSPSVEQKHIHFNNCVQQCIAVDAKGEDNGRLDTDRFSDDGDSDGVVTMKRTRSRKIGSLLQKRKRAPSTTTLKYCKDTPAVQQIAIKHGTSRSTLIPPSSQAILHPSALSHGFFSDEEDHVVDTFYNPNTSWRPESDASGLHRSASSGSLADEPAGMRRTSSGMFMPYGEEVSSSEDIFGWVIDTVNTARDMAYFIWHAC